MTTRILIIEPCYGFGGKIHEAGEELEMSFDQAVELLSSGRAIEAPKRSEAAVSAAPAPIETAAVRPVAETAKKRR